MTSPPQDAGDEGACAGVDQEPATDIYANQGWTPDDPAISGEQSTGGVRDKVFQAIISGDDAWDITDRVLAALSAPVDNPPTCQACGGEIEGWTCQSCARLFRENPSGALVMDPVDKGEAVALLEGWGENWVVAKGRLTPSESLYGCQLMVGTDVVAEGEGATLLEAVNAAFDSGDLEPPALQGGSNA